MILCSNPKAQYLARKDAIDAAIRRVLDSGQYILGPEVRAFESEFAAYIGSRHCIGVSSGTAAIEVALRACGIGPGDEVITTAHTAVATVAAIELCGARPVFVDIEPDCFTLDAAKVETAISPATKAIVPVHLYGQAADIPALADIARRRGLRLIEDCAQAHGAELQGRKLGRFGDLGCFSCYPTKNLGAIGDGGIIVTDSDELARACRLLREYGWAERYVSHVEGNNSRLDEIQAAILRVKLPALDADNARRSEIAARYDELLSGSPYALPKQRAGARHVYHLYVVRSKRRDAALEHLRAAGVGALVHYPVPIHLQPAYAGRIRGAEALPETERAAREVLSLPIYPELGHDEVRTVVAAARSAS
jgi:dTDP-4-amino-4,6-dideoxygalactose transaminase